MDYSTLNADILEQHPDIFYGRLRASEVRKVQETIGTITDYMRNLDRGPFLIAGVGGVLRFADPEDAKDIDLAVVGLNYTSLPASGKKHTFQHVIDFTRVILEYFRRLEQSHLGEGGTKYNPLGMGSDRLSKGSGPFEGWDEGFGFLETEVEARTSLESLGWYNSKGLQVRYKDVRPIDIQFVFNESPEEWKQEQECLEESPLGRIGKADRFFYSVFHEQH